MYTPAPQYIVDTTNGSWEVTSIALICGGRGGPNDDTIHMAKRRAMKGQRSQVTVASNARPTLGWAMCDLRGAALGGRLSGQRVTPRRADHVI